MTNIPLFLIARFINMNSFRNIDSIEFYDLNNIKTFI